MVLPLDVVYLADDDNMPEVVVLDVGGSQGHHQVPAQGTST